MKKRTYYLRVTCGIVILSVLIWRMDATEIIEHLKNVQFSWMLASGLAILSATFLGSISVHLFINIDDELSFVRFLPVYWVSWAFSLIVPGQIGGIASLGIMLRRYGFEWQTSLGRALLDKIITFMFMILLAVLGLFSVFPYVNLMVDDFFWLLLGLAGSGAMVYILLRYSRLNHVPYLARAAVFIDSIVFEFQTVARRFPSRVIINILLAAVKVGLSGTSYWCMFKTLGVSQILLVDVVCITAISSLVAYIPISINGLGTVELSGVALFGSIGIAGPIVLSAYLALRLLVLTFAWVPTALFLIFFARGAGGTLGRSKD